MHVISFLQPWHCWEAVRVGDNACYGGTSLQEVNTCDCARLRGGCLLSLVEASGISVVGTLNSPD